jgi:hypothetical protein
VGPSLSIEPPGSNSLSFEMLLDSQGDFLEFNRGVLMQSLANFQDRQGRIVQPNNVSIKVRGTSPNLEACLQIGSDDCAKFLLPIPQLKALLRFVKAGRFLAFTLPSDGPNPQRIIQKIQQYGMLAVGDVYLKDDWVAKELAMPELVKTFRYIDFDDPFRFSSRTFEHAVAMLTLSLALMRELLYATGCQLAMFGNWIKASATRISHRFGLLPPRCRTLSTGNCTCTLRLYFVLLRSSVA